MSVWGETVFLGWFVGIALKSTLCLVILFGLNFAFRAAQDFRYTLLLGGILGIGLLPFLNLFLPPLNLTLPKNLLVANELAPVLNTEISSTSQLLWLMIMSIWLLGAIFLLGRLGLGIYKVCHLSKKVSLLDSSRLQLQLTELQKNMKLRRSVNLFINSNITTPMTWGFWKPKIILPECALNWSQEQCRMIFLHELAHIKRGDWLVQVFTLLVCAFYWFNPLAWVLAWQLRLEREKACDIKVLTSGVKPSGYASMLISMAQIHNKTPALMVKTPPLEVRLKEILAFKGFTATPKHWHILSIITTCSLAILLGSLNPVLPKTPLAEGSLPNQEEAAALMWQLMNAQEPKLTLASDYQDPNWQIVVSQDSGKAKVAIVLPNIFSLETWNDLITSPSISISVDSEGNSNKVEINSEKPKVEESDGYWL